MKALLAALLFAISTSSAWAVASVVGIWAIEGAEFRGDLLIKGEAIYLDTDGVGGLVGADGRNSIGVRIVVTSYDETTRTMEFNFTEYGRVVAKGTLIVDSKQDALVLSSPPKFQNKLYVRQSFAAMSSSMRTKSLGLEPKQK